VNLAADCLGRRIADAIGGYEIISKPSSYASIKNVEIVSCAVSRRYGGESKESGVKG